MEKELRLGRDGATKNTDDKTAQREAEESGDDYKT